MEVNSEKTTLETVVSTKQKVLFCDLFIDPICFFLINIYNILSISDVYTILLEEARSCLSVRLVIM